MKSESFIDAVDCEWPALLYTHSQKIGKFFDLVILVFIIYGFISKHRNKFTLINKCVVYGYWVVAEYIRIHNQCYVIHR